MYLDKVFGIKPGSWGNAKDYYLNYNNNSTLKANFDRIANTATFVPQKGDICVWGEGLGEYGHVSIATGDGNTSKFTSHDLNWGSKYVKLVEHNYKGFLGVLRAKDQSKLFPKEIEIRYFDANLYNMLYVDLQNAFNGDSGALKNHYETYGIKEGRVASYIFDPVFYLNKYEDLKNAFGDNYSAAFEHFQSNGIKEGRQASELFDVKYYVENNSDLKNAFGDNYILAINHFASNGITEGRDASAEFKLSVYKEQPDLAKAFGNNNIEYYKHYITFGKAEGRKAN